MHISPNLFRWIEVESFNRRCDFFKGSGILGYPSQIEIRLLGVYIPNNLESTWFYLMETAINKAISRVSSSPIDTSGRVKNNLHQ
jgi:hypothetical protein